MGVKWIVISQREMATDVAKVCQRGKARNRLEFGVLLAAFGNGSALHPSDPTTWYSNKGKSDERQWKSGEPSQEQSKNL
jgi:hypothetical protein